MHLQLVDGACVLRPADGGDVLHVLDDRLEFHLEVLVEQFDQFIVVHLVPVPARRLRQPSRSRYRGRADGYPDPMSDLEHELITDFRETQDEVDELRRIARRALVAATTAQEAA